MALLDISTQNTSSLGEIVQFQAFIKLHLTSVAGGRHKRMVIRGGPSNNGPATE